MEFYSGCTNGMLCPYLVPYCTVHTSTAASQAQGGSRLMKPPTLHSTKVVYSTPAGLTIQSNDIQQPPYSGKLSCGGGSDLLSKACMSLDGR